MYPTSAEYKRETRTQIRQSPSLAQIFVGAFDDTAYEDSTLNIPDGVFYSNPDRITSGINVNDSYVTFEENYFRLDGSQILLPDYPQYRTQGLISEIMSDENGDFETPPEVNVTFNLEHTMPGLSIKFGVVDEDVPGQITVISYRDGQVLNTQVFTEELTPFWQGQLLFEDVDAFKIRFDKTKSGYGRIRLGSMEFGIGYNYMTDSIINITEKHTDSPVGIDLPSDSLTFTIENEDGRFDVDGDTALIRFFLENQQVTVKYGFRLPSGEEWVSGGKWYLSEWSVDGMNAKFTAKSALSALNDTEYEKSVFTGNEVSLYDLAEDVLEDAGVENYYIDPYLNEITTSAPLPVVSHAAALQLISQLGISRLFVDRYGAISIMAIIPDVEFLNGPEFPEDLVTYYSDIQGFGEDKSKDYATFENQYFKLDGSMYLLPDGNNVVEKSGLSTQNLSSENGTISEDGNLFWEVYAEEPTNAVTVEIGFGGQIPKEIKFEAYKDNSWSEPLIFYPTDEVQKFTTNYIHITGIRITILQMQNEDQRSHLSKMSVSGVSDFVLSSDQILGNPKGKTLTRLRNVTSSWISRTVDSGTLEEIGSASVDTNSGWIRIDHECGYNMSVVLTDPNDPEATDFSDVTIEQIHYAFVSYIRLTSENAKTLTVSVQSNKIIETVHPISANAYDTGEDLPIDNPLYSNEFAQRSIEYIRDYYERRTEFETKSRGYPEISSGDYIYLWKGSLGQIIETNLTYNGAFNETMKIRK